MAYPISDHCTARRERQLRRMWRREFKELGRPYPTMATIAFVELDAIRLPEWAYAKRIKGLSWSDYSIWMRRILARQLFSQDERAGGHPKITFSLMRPCKLCKRILLGDDAERRFKYDLLPAGWCIPCDTDCKEVEQRRKKVLRVKSAQ
jgi:hypothetical protein